MHLHTTSQPAVHRVARVYGGHYCHCRWHRGHTWSYVMFRLTSGVLVLRCHHRGWTDCGRGHRHRSPCSRAHVPQKAKMTERQHCHMSLCIHVHYLHASDVPLCSCLLWVILIWMLRLYLYLVRGRQTHIVHCV